MMDASKRNHVFLLSFIILSMKLSYCLCPEMEKHSLLTLKKSLKNPYNLLSSWEGEVDCCQWKGVICNNSTGHVNGLHLPGSWSHFLSGKISPSLLNLTHLTYLNLSGNDFAGTIPSFMGSLSILEQLDLSFSYFEGSIPHNIGNLSNLHTLRLQGFGAFGLHVESLEWLLRLWKLVYLNMNGVNLSRATSWAKVITTLPCLQEIHLSGCTLDFSHPPNNLHLTSLLFLDLSFNSYGGPVILPQWVFQLNNLLSLDLIANYFIEPIPTATNATKLQYLDLSFCIFNSTTVPDWIYLCKDLEFLHLRSTSLHTEISNSIGNLTSLRSLDLSGNLLYGKIPREITTLCRIQSLDLSSNELHGEVKDSFGNMSACFMASLEELILENNNFTGNLPQSFGQLSNLEMLDIDNNMLEGIVTEKLFTNLFKLYQFSASGNPLILDVGTNWSLPSQLQILGLGSWRLGAGSQTPSWLQMPINLLELDISNAGISGSIPTWFSDICVLNVSHNNFHGSIPHITSNYGYCAHQFMYLSYNKLNGSLPQIGGKEFGISNVIELDLSHNSFTGGLSNLLCDTRYDTHLLQVLLLNVNQLGGEIPDCWEKWPLLVVLKLDDNTISGSIPNSIGFLTDLESLSLHSNKLSGEIPFTMRNCTSIWKLDLSHNNLDGNIPTWMGTSLVNLKFLILRSNKLNGEISSHICHLQSLQILDLSNNQFSGVLPRCVSNFSVMATKRSLESERISPHTTYGFLDINSGRFTESVAVVTKRAELEYSTILSLVNSIDLSCNNFSGGIPKELTSLVELQSLNLSGNHLTGPIPESIGNMKQLESLDFSRNYLSGHIPNGFKALSYLSHLNLSMNKLTGRIPESTQLQGFEASSFVGNDLCGPPSTTKCSGDGVEVNGVEGENGDEKSEVEWLYVLLSLGYALGFSGACSALVLKKSWKDAYFGVMECIWNKLYVYLCSRWARLTKPAAPTS